MTTLNQKENIPSVFTYKYFWLAIAIPVSISLILMCFIWINDRLIPEWPSKSTLETFLTYMSVPLWVLGSSIPFATLAAANFRAIQFQENLKYQKDNLEFQKRNIERQEYEHALDLYHKELSIFKEKLESVLENEKYEFITSGDSTMIFTRLYEKPSKTSLNPIKPNEQVITQLSTLITSSAKGIKALDNLKTIKETRILMQLKVEFLEKYFPIYESEQERKKIAKFMNLNDFRILQFLLEYENILKLISHTLGIRLMSLSYEKLHDILKYYFEVTRFYASIQDEETWPKERAKFDVDENAHLARIVEGWLNDTSIHKETTIEKLLTHWSFT